MAKAVFYLSHRITYLPCVPVMAAVVPSGRTLVKASSAGTLGMVSW